MSDYRRNLAWKAGNKAALAGKGRHTCKRQPGTIFFDDWHDGFDAGRDDVDVLIEARLDEMGELS
jgi:hypothetical protein